MRHIAHIASSTIRAPRMNTVLRHHDGETMDIVKEILDTDRLSQNDTKTFAPHLKRESKLETLSTIWHFVKRNIKYVLDPSGIQYVKTPARTWYDKYADCKSYSIFIASILKNLGISFSYRFVSYAKGGEYTHVYVVVPHKGTYIIMDCVMPEFNTEKPYALKKDFPMAKIYQVSGVPQKKVIDLGSKDISQITDGEMDLLIARDRLLTEKSIVEEIAGIGSLKAEKYQDSIDMIDDALDVINGIGIGSPEEAEIELELIAEDAINGEYSIARTIHGIGDIGARKSARKAKKAARKEKRAAKKEKRVEKRAARTEKLKKSKTGRFLLKAAKTVKKGVKAVAKVATAPVRLLAKGVLEITLPKAAPFFLYLFINDPAILAKCPPKVQAKRKKAERVADFIVNGIGMKRNHFMGIVRNGILKQLKKSPEKIIEEMTQNKVSGIGAVALIASAAGAIIEIVKKISSAFKKKGESVSKDDFPSDGDWGNIAPAAKKLLGKSIKNQKGNTTALPMGPDNPITGDDDTSPETEAGGRKVWSSF